MIGENFVINCPREIIVRWNSMKKVATLALFAAIIAMLAIPAGAALGVGGSGKVQVEVD